MIDDSESDNMIEKNPTTLDNISAIIETHKDKWHWFQTALTWLCTFC